MPATLPVSYTSASLVQQTFQAVGSMTTITSGIIALNAGDAEAFINAKLAKSYALPLATTPPILQSLATDLTIYYLITRRNLWTAEQVKQSTWPDRYKSIMEMLEQIASGQLPLVDGSGDLLEQNTSNAPIISTTSGYIPTFNEDQPSEWSQDSNKMDDIEGDRDGASNS